MPQRKTSHLSPISGQQWISIDDDGLYLIPSERIESGFKVLLPLNGNRNGGDPQMRGDSWFYVALEWPARYADRATGQISSDVFSSAVTRMTHLKDLIKKRREASQLVAGQTQSPMVSIGVEPRSGPK